MPIYHEASADLSPSTSGFSVDGGRAVLVLQVSDAELNEALIDILGTTYPNGDGKLNRILPKAHPRFPWMYASRISNIQGRRFEEKVEAGEALESENPLEYYASYHTHYLTVEFEPRPYAVIPDSDIVLTTLYWNKEDNTTESGVYYADEWYRYTDYDIVFQPELITSQKGQMVFKTQSTNAPNDKPFSAFPRMTLPNSMIRFKWFQVPFSYIESSNSYFERFVGYVNQREWYGWEPGSLLYMGCNTKRYTPVRPELDPILGKGAYSTAKLCDVEMMFLRTSRQGTDVPTSLGNVNRIAAGHNLQPWLYQRKFYYATNKAASSSDRHPTFPSFPFELFFTDPDI